MFYIFVQKQGRYFLLFDSGPLRALVWYLSILSKAHFLMSGGTSSQQMYKMHRSVASNWRCLKKPSLEVIWSFLLPLGWIRDVCAHPARNLSSLLLKTFSLSSGTGPGWQGCVHCTWVLDSHPWQSSWPPLHSELPSPWTICCSSSLQKTVSCSQLKSSLLHFNLLLYFVFLNL